MHFLCLSHPENIKHPHSVSVLCPHNEAHEDVFDRGYKERRKD